MMFSSLADSFSFSRFTALLLKEWRQMRRDPSSFIIAVLLPAALILLFGFGLSMDLVRVPSAIVLGESTPMTREIVARFMGSTYFDARIVPTRQAAEELMRKRTVDMILELPQGVTEKTAQGNGKLSLTIHGVDASAAMIIRTYATAAVGDFLARRAARGDAQEIIGASSSAQLVESDESASAVIDSTERSRGSATVVYTMPLNASALQSSLGISKPGAALPSTQLRSPSASASIDEPALATSSDTVAAQATATAGSIELYSRAWFNEANKSAWYLVPGLTIVVMTLTCSFMGSIVIAREWERGTMESFCTTRGTALELLCAKLLLNYALSSLGLALCFLIARFIFEVPVRGDPGLLLATVCLYNLWAMSFGLFLSAFTKRQFIAIQLAVIGSYLPALILSGYLFDLRSVPFWIAWVGHLMPPTYAIESVKILCLSGGSTDIVCSNLALLGGAALLFFTLALWFTRKRLD